MTLANDMTDWIDVAATSAIADGEHVLAEVDGYPVAVFRIGDEFYAIEDVCSHDGAEIASGVLEGNDIVCPRHGARFCVKTGAVKCAPAYEDIRTFAVKLENDRVWLADGPA